MSAAKTHKSSVSTTDSVIVTDDEVPECVLSGRVCHDHCACAMVPSDGSLLAEVYLAATELMRRSGRV